MTHDEIKAFIADRTREGNSLSKIQDMLAEQGVKMTFMELRLIASEIETTFWKQAEPEPEPGPGEKKQDPAAGPAGDADDFPEEDGTDDPLPPEEPAPDAPGDAPADGEPPAPRGVTSVTLDQVQRPGFLANGTVSFGSGAKGIWGLDEMGRLRVEPTEGKPDQLDIQEFQLELQRMFAN